MDTVGRWVDWVGFNPPSLIPPPPKKKKLKKKQAIKFLIKYKNKDKSHHLLKISYKLYLTTEIN